MKVEDVCLELGVSERRACRTLGQSRSTQRYELTLPVKDASILEAIKNKIKKRPRYGYRRITVELRKDKWYVNFKRVYRIWHEYDLKGYMPKRRRKRHCGCSENACNVKRAEHTRECLTIDAGKRLGYGTKYTEFCSTSFAKPTK